jgi:hypothetical protein
MRMLGRWFRVAVLAAGILVAAAEGRQAPVASAAATGTRLLGTVVSEGGESSALFGEETRFFWVQEGEEVQPGLRLVKVRTDRVVLKAEDSDEEIQTFIGGTFRGWKTGAPALAGPPPPVRRKSPLEMSPEELRRLSEKIKAQFDRQRVARPPRREPGSEDDE